MQANTRKKDDAFFDTLFRIWKDKETEAVVVPWDEQTAIVSARSVNDSAVIGMELFDIPIDDAQRITKYSEYDAITNLAIPALFADDPQEELRHDIAPHLYMTWLAGDTDMFDDFVSTGGKYFPSATIANAIRETQGAKRGRNGHLHVDMDELETWIDELRNARNAAVPEFGRFMADLHSKLSDDPGLD